MKNMNDVAKFICSKEALKKQVNIAQVKEILGVIADEAYKQHLNNNDSLVTILSHYAVTRHERNSLVKELNALGKAVAPKKKATNKVAKKKAAKQLAPKKKAKSKAAKPAQTRKYVSKTKVEAVQNQKGL